MYESPQIVLVEGDFDIRRSDHYLAVQMFGRPAIGSPPNQNLLALTPKRNQWELYLDGYTLAYHVVEAYQQASFQYGSNVTPVVLADRRTPRLDPEEWPYPKSDHNAIFQFRWKQLGVIEPFHIDVLDLTDNPWLEWVHPGTDHALALLPFRSKPIIGPTYNQTVVFWKPVFWTVDAEPDITRLSPHNYGLQLFGHVPSFTPAVPTVYIYDSMWRADQQGAVPGQGNIGITADMINYSADGADLINGGAVGIQSGLTSPPPPAGIGAPQPDRSVIIRY